MEADVRRYFLGAIGFGFVATWTAAGLLAALLSLAACAAIVAGPGLARRRRRRTRPRRTVRARPLAAEDPGELPLVPDDPSLILEFGSG